MDSIEVPTVDIRRESHCQVSIILGSASSKRAKLSSRQSGGATSDNRQNYSGLFICLHAFFPCLMGIVVISR